MTLAADAQARQVVFVTEGRDAKTIKELATYLEDHGCSAENITQTSIDMSPAFISGVTQHLPNARITFDKFHIIGHASAAVDKMRRIEQKTDKSLKGMRWTLLNDKSDRKAEAAADLDALIAKMIRSHLEGIVAWAQTRQTNGFLKAINSLFQASKRRARGFTRLSTIRSVIFLIAGKLDLHAINPHAGQPT